MHRHPDYWKSDEELVPTRRTPGGDGRQVRSGRDRDAEADRVLAEGHASNAARMAAARAGGPPPEPVRASDVGDVIATIGIIGADQ